MKNSKKAGVYKILNTSTGMCYIGSSFSFKKRFGEHIRALKSGVHKNDYLQNAWNKYGESSFCFLVVEIVEDVEKILEREQHWIDTIENLYNLCPIAGNAAGYRHTEEAKQRMSEIKKRPENLTVALKNLNTPEARANFLEAVKSDVSRDKKSKSMSGIKKNAEHRAKIGEANKRRVWTDESRKKLSDAHRSEKMVARLVEANNGRVWTDEAREKLRMYATNKKHSAETREKMSAARTGKPWSEKRKAAQQNINKGEAL